MPVKQTDKYRGEEKQNTKHKQYISVSILQASYIQCFMAGKGNILDSCNM